MKLFDVKLALGLWFVCGSFHVLAQSLKIDINNSARSDNTAPGYTAWNLATDLSSSPQRVTRVFTNAASNLISCTIAQTVPPFGDPATNLKADWGNKDGNTTSTDPSAGYRLSADGVWVYTSAIGVPYTNGGALSLTISNLPAGTHTITTYHNDLWGTHVNTTWHGTNALSRCVVSANGAPIFTNVPSFYTTNDNQCGFAFFSISNSYDGQPLTLNFDPDHSSPLDFVILNGFELDRPFAPGTTATSLFPAPGEEHVFANNDNPLPGTATAGFLSLVWLPAGFALSNHVYLGTDSNAVVNATTASPEFKGVSLATPGTNSWPITNLDSRLTYYWRVDQLDVSNGATNLVKGFTWMFRTRHVAFPSAEGYGRFARGGRGGVVIEVTNLLDYNSNEPIIPGSYRAAIEATGPRTVIFRVSGLIRLKRPCTINAANGYVTIAGQTAPGEGICLSNWRAGLTSCSDVIMRFIRCRLGDYSQQAMDGVGLGNSTHSIIDHCSISWTMDEASSSRQSGAVGSSSCNISFQHNIISEPLQHSYHYDDSNRSCTNCYQTHAFAASISGEIGSYHHNLIAHSTDRNWSLAGGLDQSSHYAGSLDIRNNVVYNWTARTTDGGVARCNYVSNYYKPFPSNPYAAWLLKLDDINTNWGNEAYYMVGNIMEGRNYQTNNWGPAFYNGATVMNMVRTNSEMFPSFINTQTATNALKFVLSDVGCNLPAPDSIDQRIIAEVINGSTHYIGTNGPTYTINGYPQTGSPNYPGIIDSQTDVHDATNSPNYPWPAYVTFNVPVDSDHDGLPDWWEAIKGLNPNSAPGDFFDANADPDGDGYSNLEDYLNWLALPHFECVSNSSVDIDLSQFTRGFSNAPVRAVASGTNGTVTLLGDGKTARFTPTAGFVGLGGFQFTVHDSVSATLTNAAGIHIGPPSRPTITSAGWNPGHFNLSVAGQAGPDYGVQSSTDLRIWATVFITNAPAMPFSWSDTNTTSPRFYRIKVGPPLP
jgi:hypothetical protein